MKKGQLTPLINDKREQALKQKNFFVDYILKFHVEKDFFTNFRKKATKFLRFKYLYSSGVIDQDPLQKGNPYEIQLIHQILDNKKSRIVGQFKDNIIFQEPVELLKTYYLTYQSKHQMIFNSEVECFIKKFYPNYLGFPREVTKILYNYLNEKQKLILMNENQGNDYFLFEDKIFNSEFYNSMRKEEKKEEQAQIAQNVYLKKRPLNGIRRNRDDNSYHDIENLVLNIEMAEEIKNGEQIDEKFFLRRSTRKKTTKKRASVGFARIVKENTANVIEKDNLLITSTVNAPVVRPSSKEESITPLVSNNISRNIPESIPQPRKFKSNIDFILKRRENEIKRKRRQSLLQKINYFINHPKALILKGTAPNKLGASLPKLEKKKLIIESKVELRHIKLMKSIANLNKIEKQKAKQAIDMKMMIKSRDLYLQRKKKY